MWHWVAWLSAFVFNFQYLMSRLLLQLLMNHTPFYFDFLQSLHQLLHKLLYFYYFKIHSMCTLAIYCSFTAKTFFQDYSCNASWICNWTTFTWTFVNYLYKCIFFFSSCLFYNCNPTISSKTKCIFWLY